MIARSLVLMLGLAALGACTLPDPAGTAPAAPPSPPSVETDEFGLCWGTAMRPAVYQEVTGEIQVVPPLYDAEGRLVRVPVYRRTSVPELVTPRRMVRFKAVCPKSFTPEFISSVQRALGARGFYASPVSGEIDGATQAAIRSYQARRGLDSSQLALDTARDLGLIAVDLSEL